MIEMSWDKLIKIVANKSNLRNDEARAVNFLSMFLNNYPTNGAITIRPLAILQLYTLHGYLEDQVTSWRFHCEWMRSSIPETRKIRPMISYWNAEFISSARPNILGCWNARRRRRRRLRRRRLWLLNVGPDSLTYRPASLKNVVDIFSHQRPGFDSRHTLKNLLSWIFSLDPTENNQHYRTA